MKTNDVGRVLNSGIAVALLLFAWPATSNSEPVTTQNISPEQISFSDSASFQAQSSLAVGLVAHYNFDDGTATDSSGNGNHGTIFGNPQVVGGARSAGLKFDGIDDYIEVPNSTSLNPSQITMAAWVNPLDISQPVPVHKHYAILNKEEQYEVAVFGQAHENASAQEIAFAFNPSWYWRGGNYFVHLGEFIHVVVTFDASYKATVYVDGTKTKEFQYTRSLTSLSSCLRIGARGCHSNFSYQPFAFFNGILDDVRIYNRALSQNEVSELYERTRPCNVPFFWQRDSNGINGHPLRGTCGTNFDTLGEGGCTLTSATMLFRYYGADTTTNNVEMTPPNLSDCMNTNACPFNWITGVACSDGKASSPRRDTNFSYTRLDQELNRNRRPVILQMCRPKGACNWEGPITHWVLVVGGQGTDPANYPIWDPWFECGQNMRLNSRSDTWDFVGMAVYDGTPTCSFSTEVPLCARSVSPVGLPSGANATIVEQNTATPLDLAASSNVSGTAVLYRATNITMTVHFSAQSSVGNVTDMVIWSDTISNTIWQPFAPYVWLPLSDFVYAQFRDDMGNISAVVSDTPNPSAPPVAPDPDRVYLPLVTRR
jgi:hypothetical protein